MVKRLSGSLTRLAVVLLAAPLAALPQRPAGAAPDLMDMMARPPDPPVPLVLYVGSRPEYTGDAFLIGFHAGIGGRRGTTDGSADRREAPFPSAILEPDGDGRGRPVAEAFWRGAQARLDDDVDRLVKSRETMPKAVGR